MLNDRRLTLWLFASFSIVAASFIAASVYSNWLSVAIEGEAHQLLENALPSVQHLTVAIDALHELEAGPDDYADLDAAARSSMRWPWPTAT